MAIENTRFEKWYESMRHSKNIDERNLTFYNDHDDLRKAYESGVAAFCQELEQADQHLSVMYGFKDDKQKQYFRKEYAWLKAVLSHIRHLFLSVAFVRW